MENLSNCEISLKATEYLKMSNQVESTSVICLSLNGSTIVNRATMHFSGW